jgi:hypothetical protein
VKRTATLTLCAALAACSPAPDAAMVPHCRLLQDVTPLPAGLEESSGVVVSLARPGVLWTHNDSGWDAVLFAVRSTGALLGEVEVQGAGNRDWEDIAFGPCPAGECLYIGDIGDNAAVHDEIAVYRVPEPAPGDARSAPAERFPMRYPEGPRDAEALFVLPDGQLFVVTKGRASPVTLYRYPPPLREGETVMLERVVDLAPGPQELFDQVTGADATRDGAWVAIRTYQGIRVYDASSLVAGDTVPALRLDLGNLGEAQGEGIAMLEDGWIALTSEAAFDGEPGLISILSCELPGAPEE